MTPADWKIVEDRLKHQYDTVSLLCDGYHVSLRLSQISQFKMAITFGNYIVNSLSKR
jgi:hypothetical protein